jgi:transposase
VVTAGQRHESVFFEGLMDTVAMSRRRQPDGMSGDKNYSYPRTRTSLRRRGIEGIILTRSNGSPQPFDCQAYRGRNQVERCIGWLKHCRRLATQYDKLACNYPVLVKMAITQHCIRVLDPSSRI